MAYFQRLPSTQRVRFRVPADLKHLLKRGEIVRTLKTDDQELAALLTAETHGQALRLFRHLRSQGAGMTQEQVERLVSHYMQLRLDEVDTRLSAPGDASSRESLSHRYVEQLEQMSGQLATGDYSTTHSVALAMLPEGTGEAHALLSRRLLEAKIDALQAELDGMSGRTFKRPQLLTGASPTAASNVAPAGPLVSTLLDEFMEYRDTSDPYRPVSRGEALIAFGTMLDLLGDRPISEVRNRDAQEYALKVAQLPVRWRQRFPEKTAPEVLARPESKEGSRLAPATFNKETGLVKAFWTWAVQREELPNNAFKAIKKQDTGTAKDKRRSFTDDEMRFIATMLDADKRKRIDRYWIVSMLAYTGARLEEIAQLRHQDVTTVDGVVCLRITGEAGSVKNAASERIVPVHSALIAKGFLKFTGSAPDGHLFSDADQAEDRSGQPISKWFARVLDKLKVADRRKIGLHSFRHTMISRLRQAGVSDHTARELTGHAHGDVHDSVYGDRVGPLELQTAIEKVALPI
jgi:integrase